MATIRGGAKFQAALRDLARKVDKPGTVRIGFLSKARYPDGTPVAMIAAINEYGRPSVGQPPRPFFRRMIAAKQDGWSGAMEQFLKANQLDAIRTLDDTGALIAGQLRQSIRDLVDPPLKPATVQRKGFDKPLIETGHMWNSVDHEVKA